MRKALSIVIQGLLVMLPVEQILAQASQQEAIGVQQTAPSDHAAGFFRVPPLTQNSALLLGTSSEGALLDTPFADAPLAQQDPDGGWWGGVDLHWRILMVVAVGAGVITSFYLMFRNACPTGGCFTES